ncbi:hypothetical protein D9M68_972740 [compost metagenome]
MNRFYQGGAVHPDTRGRLREHEVRWRAPYVSDDVVQRYYPAILGFGHMVDSFQKGIQAVFQAHFL